MDPNMESKTRSKRNQRKKVVKGNRNKRKGKRISRKDKKPEKNLEKKTRSGCTYSPYEVFLEQIQIPTSNSSSQSEKIKLPLTGQINPDKPNQRIANASNTTELKIVEDQKIIYDEKQKDILLNSSNNFKEEQNLIVNKINQSNEISSIINNSCNNIYKTRRKRVCTSQGHSCENDRIYPSKGGKKRGRKPRVSKDNASSSLLKDNNYDTSCKDKLIFPVNISSHSSVDTTLKLPKKLTETKQKTKNENEIWSDVTMTNETEEIKNLELCKEMKVFDWVFPDPELYHTITEEEFGNCAQYGCNSTTKLSEFEKNVINNVKFVYSSNCMFTDTDKYLFKSCFKNIHSQIQNFDRYRGAETPGGDACLYDVCETSPIDNRKLYRKNFSDMKLNTWYNYVYHSAQLARNGTKPVPKYDNANKSGLFELRLDDIFFTPLPARSSRYLPGDYIWECNNCMGIPSVNDVLDEYHQV